MTYRESALRLLPYQYRDEIGRRPAMAISPFAVDLDYANRAHVRDTRPVSHQDRYSGAGMVQNATGCQ